MVNGQANMSKDELVYVDERLAGMLGCCQDLKFIKESLQVIFQNIVEGIIVTDTERNIILINETARDLMGWYKGITGNNLDDIFNNINKEIEKNLLELIDGVIHRKDLSGPSEQFSIFKNDGKKRVVSYSVLPVIIREEIDGLVIIFRDITRQRQMKDKLKMSEKKYQAVFENTGAASCIIKDNTIISRINKKMELLTGYTRKEIEDRMSWTELVPFSEDLDMMLKYHNNRRKGNNVPKNYKTCLKTKKGKIKYVMTTVDIIPDSRKSIASFIDISDLKQTEEKLENTVQDLNELVNGAINALGSSVDARDPYTSGHQKRVAELAFSIARRMGLNKDRCRGIRLAALIHDIGKLKVPIEILSKPTKLTEMEFRIIKGHSRAGYEILKGINFPWPIADFVLQHHEKINGSGYPEGLQKGEILLESRILTVADVVEAMTSHRPYRPALGLEKAVEEIKNNKGILYDPEVVDICIDALEESRII